MTVKSNTRNPKSQSHKPKSKQISNGKTKASTGVSLVKDEADTVLLNSQTGGTLVQESRMTDTLIVLSATPGTPEIKNARTDLVRPVAGRQWNDSRIPSLEDHVRIVQMMHAGERGLKSAAKDLAVRLGVSRKEALAALQACS